MRHILLQNSGNMGKTTIGRTVLAERMKNPRYISVETISADGRETETMTGDEYGVLHDEILLLEDAIVDVGASNVDAYITAMLDYSDAAENFDRWIIPVIAKDKPLNDAAAMAKTLIEIGVPRWNIVIVRNMVHRRDPMRGFEELREWNDSQNHPVSFPDDAYLLTNEIYHRINGSAQRIVDMAADKTDYKTALVGAKTMEKKQDLIRKRGIKSLASGVKEQHDRVYQAILACDTPEGEL